MSNALVPAPSADLLYDPHAFGHGLDLARELSKSDLIPPHFRGKPADVLLALTIAQRQNQHPLLVMQSLYIIQGKAGWAAQYVIAMANASGRFRGGIGWRVSGSGDDLAVTAYATLAETGEEVAFTVTMAMAKADGWASRNSKYKTLPELMLRYRSATLLVRLYAPDVLMGLHDQYEIIDSKGERGTVTHLAEYTDPEPTPPSARGGQAAAVGSSEREALLVRLDSHRKASPDVVRAEAKGMGLTSPGKASDDQLRELLHRIDERLAVIEEPALADEARELSEMAAEQVEE